MAAVVKKANQLDKKFNQNSAQEYIARLLSLMTEHRVPQIKVLSPYPIPIKNPNFQAVQVRI